MDAFALRQRVLADYHNYVSSFLNIRNDDVRQFVTDKLTEGALWPYPLLQLNPAYEHGNTSNTTPAGRCWKHGQGFGTRRARDWIALKRGFLTLW